MHWLLQTRTKKMQKR